MAADERTFGTSAGRSSPAPCRRSRAGSPMQGSRQPSSTSRASAGRRATPTRSAVTITASRRRARARDLVPFRAAIAAGAPIVMVSNASYPALDAKPAPWSPRVQALLRGELGFEGVTITDALDGAAATRGRTLLVGCGARRSGGRRPAAAHRQRDVERRRLRAGRRGRRRRGGLGPAALRASYDRIRRPQAHLWLRTALAAPARYPPITSSGG